MNTSVRAPRLDYLDAVRAFALLLGIVFHASLSFMPMFIGWAVMDVSTSPLVPVFVLVSHSFRMEVFFLIAGFFSHMTFHRQGISSFLESRFLRIVISFVIGWFLLYPLIISGWIMGAESLRGDVNVWAGLKGGLSSFASLPHNLLAGTHLWFLYYLILITLLILLLRAGLALAGSAIQTRVTRALDAGVALVAHSRLPVVILAIPTAACLWFMQGWGMDTPDRSLAPDIPVTLVYGGCFLLGWLLHRNADLLSAMARITPARCVIAIASIIAALLLSPFQTQLSHPYFNVAHAGFVLAYGLMMWSLVLLTIGVFRKVIRKPSPAIRYLADSSYWLYLVHLPLVVWLQVAFAELPLHWSVKLAAISFLTIGLSLALYDLCVRNTIIGQILNGRRRPRVLFRRRFDIASGNPPVKLAG